MKHLHTALVLCFLTSVIGTGSFLPKRRKMNLNRSMENFAGQPTFTNSPKNVTVVENQEVTLTCSVSALHEFKLAWVHEDSQSIISIGRQLHTHSKRLSLAADHRTAAITISPVLASDRGWYMCQINTDPMTFSRSYLQVLVPPTIEEWSGPEVEAKEGSTVRLICLARAYPAAQVLWRRTDAEPIFKGKDSKHVWVVRGVHLEFPVVSRGHSATYTCHISNKETQPISRDTQLIVTYPPMLWLQHELIGVRRDHDVTISCITDANPPPRHLWLKNGTKITRADEKYRPFEKVHGTSWKVMLTIRNIQTEDISKYSCIATNPIGQAEGTILLYEIKEQLVMSDYGTVKEMNKITPVDPPDQEREFPTTVVLPSPKIPTDEGLPNKNIIFRNQGTARNKFNFTTSFSDITLILGGKSCGGWKLLGENYESVVTILVFYLYVQ